ncbi:MAG: hypothetical protein ABSE66_03580 [Thermoplasmata archaeon]|jgi:hypothetical protein
MAVLMTAVLLVGGVPGAAHAAAPPGSTAATRIQPDSPPNGNLSISIPEPAVPVVSGSYLIGQFRVSVVVSNMTEVPPVLTIWVPQALFLFNLTDQTIRSFGPRVELNFTGGGPYVSNPINGTTLVKVGGGFNSSARALLSTQLLAFMSNAPYGALLLSVNWRWAIAFPDGSSLFGPWSPASVLQPAEYAGLASYGPATLPPGGWFEVCVTSSGVTREFSLHLETINPVDDFVGVEQNISANATQPVCWSAQVASWVTPQPLVAHVWAYDQKTYLLYLIKITVANPTGPYAFLAPWETWNALVTLCAIGVAGGLAVWGWMRFSSGRRP